MVNPAAPWSFVLVVSEIGICFGLVKFMKLCPYIPVLMHQRFQKPTGHLRIVNDASSPERSVSIFRPIEVSHRGLASLAPCPYDGVYYF